MVYRLVACMSSLEILDLTPSMKVGTSCTPKDKSKRSYVIIVEQHLVLYCHSLCKILFM